ncbi:AAA family ATPase [Microvirga tunisiensis]|uniref:AAA family ATPase n=1 Tax=Microvirga tunisiensis TaxID=2108360 RepID=UPI001386B70D|nr:AAA family ATPase [Microvirga tunisiensis]
MQPSDLNFPVEVVVWNEPHPKVPVIRPEFTFDAEKLTPILWSIENGYNSALVGPPGCGKTTITEQIAARLGRPWFRIPIDGEMRRREIVGGFKQVVENGASTTKWFDGIALQAMKLPAIIDVDEIDRGDPDLQYLAHQLYEGNGITILEDEGRVVYPHPKVAIMATANTKGRADGMNLYALVQEMSEATRDRFAFWIDFDYQTEENEVKQIRKEVQNLPLNTATNIVRIAGAMRIALREGKLRSAFSYRQVKACARYAAFQTAILHDETKACVESVKKIIVNRGSDEAESGAIAELARKVMGDDWPAEENVNP